MPPSARVFNWVHDKRSAHHTERRPVHPPARPGRLADDRRRSHRRRQPRPGDRVSARRHRRHLPQRSGCGTRDRRVLAATRRDLRHHEAVEQGPGPRPGPSRSGTKPRETRPRPRGPVPDPLALPRARHLRGDLGTAHRLPFRGSGPFHRGVQLPARASRHHRRRDRHHPGRGPDRTAPHLPARRPDQPLLGPADHRGELVAAGAGRRSGASRHHPHRRTRRPPNGSNRTSRPSR